MEMDERLEVLILRTLGLSQEDVAGVLNCAKQSVVEVDRWFRDGPRGESFALLDDQRITRLVNRDFPSLGLEAVNLIRAAQITADDILLHYGWVSPTDAASGQVAVVPAYALRLEEHWAKLRQMAVTFREQLTPPTIRQLFAAEICGTVHAASESGTWLLAADSWKQVFDVPLEAKAAASGGEGAVEARLLVEKEYLFPHLMSHLRAEFPEFAELDVWKTELAQLIGTCLEQARDVTLSSSTAAGLPYMRAGTQEWLSFQFPAYVCQFVLNYPRRETAPGLLTERQPDGSWRLVPEDFPAITLAGGKAVNEEPCREALASEVRRNARLEVWQQISSALAALESTAGRLRLQLTTVAERGDFAATCPLCEKYFVRTGHSRGGPA